MTETTSHEHTWAPMPGPDYDYRPNRQMWQGEKAAVQCTGCRCRTWLSREEVARYAAAGQAKERHHG